MHRSKVTIPFELKDHCCPRFHCGADDHDFIQGKNRPFKGDELEPLTTYFHRALHSHKTINGNKIAINFYDRCLTFNDLSKFSTAIALELIDRVQINETTMKESPSSDVIFAFCLPSSEKLIAVIFGILKTGAAYLPLDPQYPEEILLGIIRRFKPKALITDESGPILCKYDPEDFSDICELISLEDLWLGMNIPSEHGEIAPLTALRATLTKKSIRHHSTFLKEPEFYPYIVDSAPTIQERLAVVIQTTRLISDNPQGVRLSHLNIMNRITWTWDRLPYLKHGSCCLSVPVSCSDSISQIFGPLLKGTTLHVLARKDTKMMGAYIRVIGDKKITRISLSPVVFHDFINECANCFTKDELKKVLKYLRYVNCRGQIVSRALISQFLSVFPSGKSLCSLYGHPELTGDLICEVFKGHVDVEHKSVLGRLIVGKTVANTRIYILNEKLLPVPEGEQGQICVSGVSVGLGYVDEKSNDGVFVQNPFGDYTNPNFSRLFCTGDYGRFVRCRDRKLRLLIEGRSDQLIHHLGYDFILDDIEKTMLNRIEVEKVEIRLLHPGKYDQNVVAFTVLKKQYAETTLVGELDFQLHAQLPEFMIPELRLMKSIPTLETGRIDSFDLLQEYEEGRDPGFTDWTLISHVVVPAKAAAAKVLLEGLYKFCSIPVTVSIANMHLSAYDLGCTSNNTVSTLMYIVNSGFPITLHDFLSHTNLLQLISKMEKMARSPNNKYKAISKIPVDFQNLEVESEFSTQLLASKHKKAAIHLLATCYCEKGLLEKYNLVIYEEYVSFLETLWDDIVKQQLSICCIRNSDSKLVGVIISHDFFTDMDHIKIKGSLHHIVEFRHAIKVQFLHEIPHDLNNTLETWLLGTAKVCKPRENVTIVALLLTALLQLGEARNFVNVYITTANQLVENMCHHMLNYELLDDYPAYAYDEQPTINLKPFHLAPITVSVKTLLYNLMTPKTSAGAIAMHKEKSGPSNCSPTTSDRTTK